MSRLRSFEVRVFLRFNDGPDLCLETLKHLDNASGSNRDTSIDIDISGIISASKARAIRGALPTAILHHDTTVTGFPQVYVSFDPGTRKSPVLAATEALASLATSLAGHRALSG